MDILVTLWTPAPVVHAKTDQPDVIFLRKPRIHTPLLSACWSIFYLHFFFSFFLLWFSQSRRQRVEWLVWQRLEVVVSDKSGLVGVYGL